MGAIKKSCLTAVLVTGICSSVLAFILFIEAGPLISITISGNRIIKDGTVFVPNGYIFEAFVSPREQLMPYTNSTDPKVKEYCNRVILAQEYYAGTGQFGPGGRYANNKSALRLAKEWGANTMRLNLNQCALDPQNSAYSTQYLSEVTNAIARARAVNLLVIATMFTAANTNIPAPVRALNPQRPLATPTTLRALLNLEQYFGSDQGVMLEWLNENWPPCGIREAWTLWRDGGFVSYSNAWYGVEFTGVNEMLKEMRAAGSQNPIIIQGLGTFDGFPGGVSDPSNKLIYAIHPFPTADPDSIDWDTLFGNFVTNKAFVATAWGATSSTNGGWCQAHGLDTAANFLDYIDVRDIGLMGYAIDVPWTMITHFTNSVVGVRGFGSDCTEWGSAGALMTNYVMSSQIDTNPPVVGNWQAEFVTNTPQYIWINISENYGYWSTNNGAEWNRYTNGTGAGFWFTNTATLWAYGRDAAGNCSATNMATYTVDTTAPVVKNWRASFATNEPHYIWINISENYGYWSTNNGAEWNRYTNGTGAHFWFTNTVTLWAYGRDELGNCSVTNKATYTIL
jgi:hypothetical protein